MPRNPRHDDVDVGPLDAEPERSPVMPEVEPQESAPEVVPGPAVVVDDDPAAPPRTLMVDAKGETSILLSTVEGEDGEPVFPPTGTVLVRTNGKAYRVLDEGAEPPEGVEASAVVQHVEGKCVRVLTAGRVFKDAVKGDVGALKKAGLLKGVLAFDRE